MKLGLCLLLILVSTAAAAVLPCEPKTAKERRLLELAYTELTPEFQKLITQGANPNVCDSFGASLIVLAATWNFPRSAAYLLSLPKVDVNLRDGMHWPAIAYAVARSNLEVVEQLVRSPRTQIDILLPKSQSIYHVLADAALDTRHVAMTQVLLSVATEDLLNQRNDRGLTPLHVAIRAGSLRLVEAFLDTSLLDLRLRAPSGLGYADFAREAQQIEIAEVIEAYVSPMVSLE